MFRTSYVHHQEDYIVHAALYGMISCIYTSSLSGCSLLDCLHKCMKNITHKAACTI